MKYIIFAMAVFGVPPLAWLMSINRRWMRLAFWCMAGVFCVYQSTSINFFSREFYRGTSRGMETCLIHLLCAAILLSLGFRGRIRKFLPGWGFRLYFIYILLCLPSLRTSVSDVYFWCELWKMLLTGLIGLTVYWYLDTTRDVETPVAVLAAIAIINAISVGWAHFSGAYQPNGIFPHRNSMAMAMTLIGPVFFAAWLERGPWSRFGRLCAVAFVCAGFATFRSLSRGAIVLAPLGYAITAISCVSERVGSFFKLRRVAPFLLLGAIGLGALAHTVIERFETAPESSGNTRIELAKCAREMIADEPWRGIGLNNWGMKINAPWPYAERAGRNTNRSAEFQDGIVETVYLLVAAECGIPALLMMLTWFGWHWAAAFRTARRLRGTRWHFLPAGLLGGFTANYIQSALEWVLKQPLNMILLMFCFAMTAYLDRNRRILAAEAKEETGRT